MKGRAIPTTSSNGFEIRSVASSLDCPSFRSIGRRDAVTWACTLPLDSSPGRRSTGAPRRRRPRIFRSDIALRLTAAAVNRERDGYSHRTGNVPSRTFSPPARAPGPPFPAAAIRQVSRRCGNRCRSLGPQLLVAPGAGSTPKMESVDSRSEGAPPGGTKRAPRSRSVGGFPAS